MIFFHIIDDYNLQGWLASAKQKSYWKETAPDKKYEHDYIWALIMHSFSWTFMVMLPIAYVQEFNIGFGFFILFIFNIAIHAITDNAKANWKLINLWQDQFIHLAQIFLTSILLYI
jgi:hypothetical protein